MAFIETDKQTNYVKIEMQNGDSVVVELDEKAAPITVANFKKLVAQGFYDGLSYFPIPVSGVIS